jgi:hypothetical protein
VRENHHRLVHWTARGGYRDEHFEQEAALHALVAGEPLDPMTSDEWTLPTLAASSPEGISPGLHHIRGRLYLEPDGLIALGLLEKVPTTFDNDGPCGWCVRATPRGHALLAAKAQRLERSP